MACASESIHRRGCVNACSIILAWILWCAIVNVDFAVLTFVAIWAVALVQGNKICTGSAILTWRVFALIDFLFASRAFITWLTGAGVVVDFINASGFV